MNFLCKVRRRRNFVVAGVTRKSVVFCMVYAGGIETTEQHSLLNPMNVIFFFHNFLLNLSYQVLINLRLTKNIAIILCNYIPNIRAVLAILYPCQYFDLNLQLLRFGTLGCSVLREL